MTAGTDNEITQDEKVELMFRNRLWNNLVTSMVLSSFIKWQRITCDYDDVLVKTNIDSFLDTFKRSAEIQSEEVERKETISPKLIAARKKALSGVIEDVRASLNSELREIESDRR